MKMEDATGFTARCFNGEPASCSFACPFHMDTRAFLEKAGKGRWAAAYKALANAVVFPVIVSTLCDQPCREHCQRTVTGDEAIALRDIEAAVIKYAKNHKPEAYFIPPKTRSVAVIGAGVAGLSCALNLAQKKYPVTVFEKEAGWGGSLRSHPHFAEFDKEIEQQLSAADVKFKFGKEIKALDELKDFDSIYCATGEGGESFGLLGDWDPELLSTSDPRVFLGGALCGTPMMQGIAQGPKLSRIMEVFLQTGKASAHGDPYDKNYCGHTLKHEGAETSPLIRMSTAGGYTEEEAKQEAERCLQCDCELCMHACEMLKRFHKKPHRMAVEVFTDMQASTLSSRSLTRETYSCNICGYCKSICPEQVDMGDLLQFSRTARRNNGNYPAALHDFWLREMEFSSTEAFFASAPEGKEDCEYALFPGCQLGASKPAYPIMAYEYLQSRYDTGMILNCCGAPAYWAGEEGMLRENMEKIRQSWIAMGRPTLIFACATCESMFHRFLPEVKRISLYELLAKDDKIEPLQPFPAAAVFDPCAAREEHGMEMGVRKLAQKAGVELRELPEKNRCCGYGGHMQTANPALYDEIIKNRAAKSTDPYIVYCVNCREVFASQSKECTHILDMVFGLKAEATVPSLQEKRDNRLKVKKELMEKMEGVRFEPAAHDWDELKLIIPVDLQKELDRKLISASDLAEAVWLAERTGDKFHEESDGSCLCSMVKSVLTYWVQYREIEPGTYEIISAYSHRMRFGREG